MAPPVLQAPQADKYSSTASRRTGPTSGRPLFPGVLRSRQSQAPGNAGEMLARGAPPGGGRTPSGPDERAGPTAGWDGRIPPPTAAYRKREARARLPNRSCSNLLRLGTRSHLVLLSLRMGRRRIARRPTHPPSCPAVQTPQMDLGQGCCLLMSGVDRELEEGARSRSVPTPPPPLIQQS
jgi:hypothetical protein